MGAWRIGVVVLLSCVTPGALRLFDCGLLGLDGSFRPSTIEHIRLASFASNVVSNAPLLAVEYLTALIAGWAPETVVSFVVSCLALGVAFVLWLLALCSQSVQWRSNAMHPQRAAFAPVAQRSDAYDPRAQYQMSASSEPDAALSAVPSAGADFDDVVDPEFAMSAVPQSEEHREALEML